LASYLSLLPQLRQVILLFQRKLTQRKGWVVVGRDITSEVLPHAEIKIFLTADLETRLKRRHQEHEEKNSLNQIKKTLLIRDERDQKRAISPLKKTKDS
jgi:cytidylate kinase